MNILKRICLLTIANLVFCAHGFAQDSTEINDYVSEVTNLVCPFKDKIDYEPGRVRCGFITVPENREVQDSRLIRLAFTKIVAQAKLDDEEEKASKEDEEALVPRADPIIYLTGGPGAGIDLYVGRFLEHDLSKTRDLYILNQRGIGDSEELCRYYSATSREKAIATSLAEQEKEDAQRMQACFKAAAERGVDLSAYNTVENARDVRALRQALGFETWNVWGISYGSHLGQMLVNVDPEGIRALVLDAIVPNDLGDLMRIHKWLMRNYKLIFDECERQGAAICEGLEEAFYASGNALIDNPMVIDTFDEEINPSGSAAVPAQLIAFAPFAMMYEQDGHPAIPAVMRSLADMVETRDIEVFQALASGGESAFSGISEGMGSAIRCNDGYMAAEANVAEQDLQEDFGFSQGAFTVQGSQLKAQACVDAGLTPRSRENYQLIESDIPTLIVNGNWDPVTPPPLAERIAPGFRKGRLIIVPYAGHGPTRSMSECAGQVLTDFFDDPTQDINGLDASCLEEGVAPPEFLDYLQTHTHLKFAARAMDDPKKLAMPAFLVSTPLFISLIGFIMICYGGLTRRISSSGSAVEGIGSSMPRIITALSALLLLVGIGLVGVGVASVFEISEISILAGFAPPAGLGAALFLLSGVLGLASIVLTLKEHQRNRLRRRTLIGFIIIGLANIIFCLSMIVWGITPW